MMVSEIWLSVDENKNNDGSILIDGNRVKFWCRKNDAYNAVKHLGYARSDLVEVHTRFCGGWSLMDERFGLITRDGLAYLNRRQY